MHPALIIINAVGYLSFLMLISNISLTQYTSIKLLSKTRFRGFLNDTCNLRSINPKRFSTISKIFIHESSKTFLIEFSINSPQL